MEEQELSQKIEQSLKDIEVLKKQKEKLDYDIREKESQVSKYLLDLDILRIEKGAVPLDSDISTLSCAQLEYICYKRYGYQKYPDRHYTTGDVSFHTFSDADYSKVLKRFMETHVCVYCKGVDHVVRDCEILEKKTCQACGKKGHTISGCRDTRSLRKKATEKYST